MLDTTRFHFKNVDLYRMQVSVFLSKFKDIIINLLKIIFKSKFVNIYLILIYYPDRFDFNIYNNLI